MSVANSREHWSSRQRRTRKERSTGFLIARMACGPERPELPLVVTLTRYGPRALDDDNLRPALKGVRDGVADYLGIDDADPRVRYEYAQERGSYAVGISLRCPASEPDSDRSDRSFP